MMFGMGWDGFGRVLGFFFGWGWEGWGEVRRGRKNYILENVWECFSRVGAPRNSICCTKIKGNSLITIFYLGARGPAAGGLGPLDTPRQAEPARWRDRPWGGQFSS